MDVWEAVSIPFVPMLSGSRPFSGSLLQTFSAGKTLIILRIISFDGIEVWWEQQLLEDRPKSIQILVSTLKTQTGNSRISALLQYDIHPSGLMAKKMFCVSLSVTTEKVLIQESLLRRDQHRGPHRGSTGRYTGGNTSLEAKESLCAFWFSSLSILIETFLFWDPVKKDPGWMLTTILCSIKLMNLIVLYPSLVEVLTRLSHAGDFAVQFGAV